MCSRTAALGQSPLSAITTAVTDLLYEKLLVVTETDASGNTIERERGTTVNHAMKRCRRVWNIAFRRHPDQVPHINPFANMGLESLERETPTATFEELQAFRAKAKEMGLFSLATTALIGWEWLQRQTDIFGTFNVAHYRPGTGRTPCASCTRRRGRRTGFRCSIRRRAPRSIRS